MTHTVCLSFLDGSFSLPVSLFICRRGTVKETPLPRLQLFLLLYLQLAEPITSTVIYLSVRVTGGDERKTGYFAGLIESSFYAVEAACVLQWGRASDRIGRKPVLLGGLLGLILSMFGFGLSRQYWALIPARCAVWVVPLGKSIFGGVFARPADHWSFFQNNAFWSMYPYFLPCVVAASLSLSAFILALFGLKEDEVSATVQEQTSVTLRSILVPRVLWPILNYAFLALADQSVVVLVPLMYSTSISLGGLGFSSFTIGIVQGVAGFVGGVVQVFTFPWMHRKLGSKWLYTLSYATFFVVFALFPLLSFVTKRAGRAGPVTWALVVLQSAIYTGTYMTWVRCIFMYRGDGAPSKKALGLTNGLAQTTASTVRAIAPAASSSLFSVTLEHHLAAGTLVYWVLCVITIVGVVATRGLPRNLADHR
ncbi:major facilitator superfamily domain-containing protein [Daedaleopsis nitida]|nr:major facilitator superfamily domain-containing protein [Daedaleopsis nitida]